MITPFAAPQKGADQNGVGDLKTIFTVWLSSLSIRTISRYGPMVTAAVAGSITCSQLNSTAEAVNTLASNHNTVVVRRAGTDIRSDAPATVRADATARATNGI